MLLLNEMQIYFPQNLQNYKDLMNKNITRAINYAHKQSHQKHKYATLVLKILVHITT